MFSIIIMTIVGIALVLSFLQVVGNTIGRTMDSGKNIKSNPDSDLHKQSPNVISDEYKEILTEEAEEWDEH